MAAAAPRVDRLEEELQEKASQDFDLFFGNARTFSEKHEKWITAFECPAKIDQIIGAEHQPDILGKK